jgi:hypothetical protein
MLMKDAPFDKNSGLYKRKTSSDGVYEIGIYPVIFGFRIRAGFVGRMWCELDYCAGADLTMINLLYNIVVTIMSKRIEQNENPFAGFPKQDVKPMINDPECLQKMMELFKDYKIEEAVTITNEDLQSFRNGSFKENFEL